MYVYAPVNMRNFMELGTKGTQNPRECECADETARERERAMEPKMYKSRYEGMPFAWAQKWLHQVKCIDTNMRMYAHIFQLNSNIAARPQQSTVKCNALELRYISPRLSLHFFILSSFVFHSFTSALISIAIEWNAISRKKTRVNIRNSACGLLIWWNIFEKIVVECILTTNRRKKIQHHCQGTQVGT